LAPPIQMWPRCWLPKLLQLETPLIAKFLHRRHYQMSTEALRWQFWELLWTATMQHVSIGAHPVCYHWQCAGAVCTACSLPPRHERHKSTDGLQGNCGVKADVCVSCVETLHNQCSVLIFNELRRLYGNVSADVQLICQTLWSAYGRVWWTAFSCHPLQPAQYSACAPST